MSKERGKKKKPRNKRRSGVDQRDMEMFKKGYKTNVRVAVLAHTR